MKLDPKSSGIFDPGNHDLETKLPLEVLKKFRLIFKAIQHHSLWVETCSGVTSAQLWAMSELASRPGSNVSDLARSMSIHQSTVSNLLDKLERKGLINRERKSLDQRVVTVQLTETGRELLAKAPAPQQGILQHALFQLPDESLRILATHLESLIREMAIKDEEAATQPLNPLARSLRERRKNKDQ